MVKKTEVKVIQDEENVVTVEVLADAIKSISDGIKKLRGGRLNDEALIMLIQHATPSVRRPGRYGKAKLSPKAIKAVLNGMESLEQQYLKKLPK